MRAWRTPCSFFSGRAANQSIDRLLSACKKSIISTTHHHTILNIMHKMLIGADATLFFPDVRLAKFPSVQRYMAEIEARPHFAATVGRG